MFQTRLAGQSEPGAKSTVVHVAGQSEVVLKTAEDDSAVASGSGPPAAKPASVELVAAVEPAVVEVPSHDKGQEFMLLGIQ